MSYEQEYKVGITPVEVTEEDLERGEVVAKFHRQAAINNALLEDKMIYLIVNDKPKRMSQATWGKMVNAVLRKEVVQKYPKLYAYQDEEQR